MDRPPFEWLLEKRHRRSALRSVETAVRRGWLDEASSEHRNALTSILLALQDQGDLSYREAMRIARVAVAMDLSDLATAKARLILAKREGPLQDVGAESVAICDPVRTASVDASPCGNRANANALEIAVSGSEKRSFRPQDDETPKTVAIGGAST